MHMSLVQKDLMKPQVPKVSSQSQRHLLSEERLRTAKPLVERLFLREKRLSNAQVRGLCEESAGPSPREMVF